MKKIYKVMTMSLVTAMLVNPISTYALTKTESVYDLPVFNLNVYTERMNEMIPDEVHVEESMILGMHEGLDLDMYFDEVCKSID